MTDDLDDIQVILDETGLPGLSLAYSVGSAPTVVRTWGFTSIDDPTPVTPETIFQAGSVTKVVTAFAALQLAAAGRLDLDADINSVLKSWQLPPAWGWQPVVTTRMLLAHVAGVSASWADGYPRTEAVPSLLDLLAGRGEALPIQQETLPGLVWSYSGGGYLIVAQAICDVTGMAFPDAVADLVFSPLGMSSSTVAEPLPEGRHRLAARGHSGGVRVSGGWRNCGHPGAAGMWTTAADLVRLGRAVSTVPEMITGHPIEPRMGLGPTLTDCDGRRWWSHGGSSPGYECLLGGLAAGGDDGFVVAVMTNADGWHGIDDCVFRMVASRRGPGPVNLTSLFGEAVGAFIAMVEEQESFVGTYRLPAGGDVVVTAPCGRHGPELQLALPGQPAVRLWPGVARRWWVAGLAGTSVTFEPPNRLAMAQSGKSVFAERQNRA